jgi:hypothetical protein
MKNGFLRKLLIVAFGIGAGSAAYQSGTLLAESTNTEKTTLASSDTGLQCPANPSATENVYFVGCGGFF